HGPVELVAGDALLAGHHEIDRLQPIAERDMACLKYSVDRYPELLPTGITLIYAGPRGLPAKQSDPGSLAAMDADRAIRPNDAFQLRIGFRLVDEVGLVENAGHR